ncbi:hypothetical protein BDP27DRAFT_1368456 [Rhodocollybia butyracea]|uniref:Uncharacterized protein n=1 Tax=Rhodocollybia butyracea TaxID=206335 RepID=A0A9P5U1Z0_9AGAR|nr:hypothetical protein BDP27DRAFT_1368456 [Rhodocollybia butyracea]
MVEEAFFIRRFWKIKITVTIQLLVHWALAIDLLAHQAVTAINVNLAITSTGGTLCAATDLFIAVVMLHTMSTIKTTYTGTQSLLRRISIQSMACGIATSVSTTLMLTFFVTHNPKPSTIIFDLLGRIYTLTILFNYLMLRKPVADANATENPTVVDRPQTVIFGPMSIIPNPYTIPRMELTSIHETGSVQLTSIYETNSGLVHRSGTEGSESSRPVNGSGGTSY